MQEGVSPEQLHFFLGGRDLEMLAIAELLCERDVKFSDAGLAWGARASTYSEEICGALESGVTPVLVELENDLSREIRTKVVVIDHHGARAGEHAATSLEQVLDLLGILKSVFTANRWWQLVAANDRGHIRAMRELNVPATDEEIRAVRLADLRAQGTTDELIATAKQLVRGTQRVAADGKLTIVGCPNDRTSLAAEVCEPLHGGPGFVNLLVVGETEYAFYGEGFIVSGLADASPDGACWFGGALPRFGFWGCKAESIGFCPESFVVELLASGRADPGETFGS